ncbi:hypothetical protein [Actinomycetospora sp. NBC_00405]|uniref:hypothetical protein n=1 Tax=Actinomycetospora sp. NBC_00405 TaxID=2975952 RepID=UPI002E218FC6
MAGSSGSRTQPVPSIAAWWAGSASTPNTVATGASIVLDTARTSVVVSVLIVGTPSSWGSVL